MSDPTDVIDIDGPDHPAVRNLLSQALSPDAPDPAVIAYRAAAHGRTLRRRRTAVQILGSTAAVALVATGIGYGIGHHAAGSEATATTATTASAVPTSYSALLAALLPHDLVKTAAGPSADPTGDGRILVDDGRGKALITVTVSRRAPSAPALRCQTSAERPQLLDCRVKSFGAQQVLLMRLDATDDVQQPGVFSWETVTAFPDGTVIDLVELNADREDGPPTRTDPPVSLADLAVITIEPGWRALHYARAGNH